MSAWAEAVWVSNKLGTSITTLQSNITAILGDIENNSTGLSPINSKLGQLADDINDNTYGLSALNTDLDNVLSLLNNSTYGLEAIADLAVKKNVVLATNAGTNNAPSPQGISNSDVVNGALFFIES